jgi:hypothetical protein
LNDLCVAEHRQDPDRPRRAMDGLYLCAGCHDQLADLLAQLPGLYADLEDALASGGASTGPSVSGSASEPLPINTAAADHRHQIQHDLRVVVHLRRRRARHHPAHGIRPGHHGGMADHARRVVRRLEARRRGAPARPAPARRARLGHHRP